MTTQDYAALVTERFIQRGWRTTAGVRNVATAFGRAGRFLRVPDILNTLQQQGHTVDTATAYRILEKLEHIGLVHNHNSTWHRCTDPTNPLQHHFMLCEKCGDAQEIFLDYWESISDQLLNDKGFVLARTELIFHGLCKKCSGGSPLPWN